MWQRASWPTLWLASVLQSNFLYNFLIQFFNFLVFFLKEHQRHHDLFYIKNDVFTRSQHGRRRAVLWQVTSVLSINWREFLFDYFAGWRGDREQQTRLSSSRGFDSVCWSTGRWNQTMIIPWAQIIRSLKSYLRRIFIYLCCCYDVVWSLIPNSTSLMSKWNSFIKSFSLRSNLLKK